MSPYHLDEVKITWQAMSCTTLNKGVSPRKKKTHIHSMTLKAFVKERVEKGLPIDLDMFGAYVARTADVKRKK